MKGALKTLRFKGRRRRSAVLEAMDLAAESTGSTAPVGGAPTEPSTEASATTSAVEQATTESGKSADVSKTPSTGSGVAILTLGQAGEITSARDACVDLLGWEPSALVGQNVRILLQGGLDNEVGRFLHRHRAATQVADEAPLLVTALRKDGSEFSATVTTRTWSLETTAPQKSTAPPEESRLSWIIAICESASPVRPEGVAELAANGHCRDHPATKPPSFVEGSAGSAQPQAPASCPNHREGQVDGNSATAKPQDEASSPKPSPRDNDCEDLQRRLDQCTAQLACARLDFEQQIAERARSESNWREQVEAAKAATANLEAEATERHHRSESELVRLRGHLEDFQTKLSTEQAAVAEWKQRNAELESSLLKTSSELGNLQTEARKQAEERGCLEFELRAQLEAAREKTGYAEAALKEETLRKEKLEERLQSLSNSLKLEQAQRSKRFEEELVGLRKERDELNGKLAAEKHAASESGQRAQELESSLGRNASEFERAKAELDRQSAEREESESKWREQLDTAWVLKEKLEGAWAGAVERNKRFEEELAALRQERNELNGKLQAEKGATEESRLRAREVENRLGRNATEFERAKSELEKQSAEREVAESEWREQLQAAKTKKEKTERALAEATERSQRFEAELAALRREQDKLTAELETAEQAATAATRRAEDCQSRLTRNTDELARVRADLEKQDAEHQRSESRWREQLETAKAQKREVDASWESAVERTMRFEQELAGLRLERDELKSKLKTQQQETARLLRQTEDLESRLQRTTAEHDRVQAELERHNAERERSASERSQQRETGEVLTRKLETARAGAVERNKRVEGELAEIRHERDELQDKLTAQHVVAAEFRKRAEELENRLAQHAGELQRVRTELEKQNTDRERLESEWRKRLEAPAPPKKSDGPSAGASGGSGGRPAEADLCKAPHISVERYNLKP